MKLNNRINKYMRACIKGRSRSSSVPSSDLIRWHAWMEQEKELQNLLWPATVLWNCHNAKQTGWIFQKDEREGVCAHKIKRFLRRRRHSRRRARRKKAVLLLLERCSRRNSFTHLLAYLSNCVSLSFGVLQF